MIDAVTAATGLAPDEIALAFAVFALGGLIKGLTGFGLPLTVVAVLSNALPIQVVLAINVLPPLILNLFQVGGIAGLVATMRRFWIVPAAMLVGTGLGALVAAAADAALLTLVLGCVTAGFAALSLAGLRPRPHPSWERPLGAVAGTAAGLTGVLTTVDGPPLVMYLISAGTDPRAFRSALAVFFIAGTPMIYLAYASIGFVTPALTALSLACVLPGAAGMWLGLRLSRHVSGKGFETAVLVTLLALGANLIRRGLAG